MASFLLKKIGNTLLNLLEAGWQVPVLHSLPRVVDVVLTKECNLACVFCKDYKTTGARQISFENFVQAARQLFPTALEVRFCSGGEPYLHRDLEDMLRLARRYQTATWLLSNGMLLTEKRVRTLVREELVSRHGFSVDGIKAATVEKVRINANLAMIFDKIQMLRRIRAEEGKRKPKIIIRYTLMRSNLEELPEAVDYWGRLGIDQLDGNYLSLCNDVDRRESLYFHQALTAEVFAEADRVARHYPRFKLKLPPLPGQKKVGQRPQKCRSPWDFVYLSPDGCVLPCYCSWGTISLGNIYEDTPFKDIWNNAGYQALRRTVNNDSLEKHYPYCAGCERRFGRSRLAAHLGDETWLAHLDIDRAQKAAVVTHRQRRPNNRAKSSE
jgi:MoaA/NifB/PqqE/SkfB family radical SAM enzyme